MFWKLTEEQDAMSNDWDATPPSGRFVLHRHVDQGRPHLDLRIEEDGHLVGWRIDGDALDHEQWATEKAPHPVGWLNNDRDATREDAGTYTWVERGAEHGRILLRGRNGDRLIRVERTQGLPPAAVQSIRNALDKEGAKPADAARLIAEGATARRRAIERFCGLARELDKAAFDEMVWREALSRMNLDQIHRQLRAYEVRFDREHPPAPVSRPERLEQDAPESREAVALAIARE